MHLRLNELVADGQHLVEEQQLGVDLERRRERQPDLHPRRVVAERHLDELLELGEADHARKAAPRLRRAQAHQRPGHLDVVARGELRVEADAQLDERREARAFTSTVPLSGSWIPAMQRSSVLLPLPLWPITAKNSPGFTSNDTSLSASRWSCSKLAIGCLSRSLSVQERWRGIVEGLREVLDTQGGRHAAIGVSTAARSM